jgi:alkyl sulfatase BDS1-like metallo-beta-lactamase superfamily hydrolase
MAVYSEARELLEVAEELFLELGRNEEVKRKTEKLECVFKFEITDLYAEFGLKIERGSICYLNGCPSGVDAVLRMDSEVFHQAMAGTLNLPAALLKKSLTIEGNTRSVLNLTKLGRQLNAAYKEVFLGRMGGA